VAGRLGVDAATWARLSPLLDEALELAASDRAEWLARLAEDSRDLRPELERLLAAPTDAMVTPAPFGDLGPAGRVAGERIGPWRLLRPLGAGGMGEVWLAERADGLMAREVALKLPHLVGAGSGLAARMARERNILAALVHPNIARLYDAGIASDGQPYLALELVHGERIDAYAARHALDVGARIELALQAAHAVAHAHAQLVVHRDIKPSNLLVDGAGQVKLLDFGIAKLLDPDGVEALDLTERGAKPLTPGYASPEQIAAAAVGTRSDVYSLAVVLYELLTGASPYRPLRAGRAALEEAVLGAEACRPSDAVADALRRRALRGDLDTILLHALRKSAEERYPTVDAFAADLECHLAHRPLVARGDGRWVVFQKFVRRNRVAVGAGALTLAGIVAGAAVAAWQASVARTERAEAQQVKDFVVAIIGDTDPYLGHDAAHLTAVDLLHRAGERLQTSAIVSPAARVEIGTMIGESLLTLGDVDGAEPVLQRAAARTRAEPDLDPALALRARLQAAQVMRYRGRIDLQQRELQALLPQARALERTHPEAEVEVLEHLSLNEIDRGAFAESEQHALQAHRLALARLGESHPETAAATIVLCTAQRYAGHFDAARATGALALRLARAAYPGAGLHPRVIEAQAMYGRALADLGELGAGIEQLEQAAQGALELFGADAPATAMLRQNLVAYQIDDGRIDAAITNGREALRATALIAPRESYLYAGTAAAYGNALLAARRGGAAADVLLPAAATLAHVLGPERDGTLFVRANAALALALAGRTDEARERLGALAASLQGAGAKAPTRARAQFARAVIERLAGHPEVALAVLQPLLIGTDPTPRLQRERMRARAEAGLALLALGRAGEAVPAFEAALADSARLETAPTPTRNDAAGGLAQARAALGGTVLAGHPRHRQDPYDFKADGSPVGRDTD
jgi:eukaryotic-like serine/threonine-protein kinase